MRRTHLRGHENIFHGGAFNLSLLLRKELGAVTPRGRAEAKKAFGRPSGGLFGAPNDLALAADRTWPTPH